MTPKEKKHNYFYKITNLVNGKYYYGIRSTDKEIEADCYFGSGTALRSAIKKYGKQNFTKEIIADYPTRKEASDHEARVVTVELVKLPECYNINTGGDNEFTFNHSEEAIKKISAAHKGKTVSDETRKKLSAAKMGIPLSEDCKRKIIQSKIGKYTGSNSPMFGKKLSNETKVKMSKTRTGMNCGENHYLFGKHHSKETRKKISEAQIGKKCGADNPMYNKIFSLETKIKMRNNRSLSKPCKIFEALYISIKEAARQLNIPPSTIKRRIVSNNEKWSDWKYTTD